MKKPIKAYIYNPDHAGRPLGEFAQRITRIVTPPPVPKTKPPFRWKTHKGQFYFVEEMATPHIFFALRMIYNNQVPPVFRIGKFKRYDDVRAWSKEQIDEASRALANELATRVDLEVEQRDQLLDMQANLDLMVRLGL